MGGNQKERSLRTRRETERWTEKTVFKPTNHCLSSFSDLLTYDVEQLSQHYSPPDAGCWVFFGFIFKIFGPKNV